MLSSSKELGVIKWKRKKFFKAFDPLEDKEENKDCHIKREKITEDNNVKIADWLIQITPKKIKQIRSIEMKETIMNQERMRVWILIWRKQKLLIRLLRNNYKYKRRILKFKIW